MPTSLVCFLVLVSLLYAESALPSRFSFQSSSPTFYPPCVYDDIQTVRSPNVTTFVFSWTTDRGVLDDPLGFVKSWNKSDILQQNEQYCSFVDLYFNESDPTRKAQIAKNLSGFMIHQDKMAGNIAKNCVYVSCR